MGYRSFSTTIRTKLSVFFALCLAILILCGCSLEPIIYNPPDKLSDGIEVSNQKLESDYLNELLEDIVKKQYVGIDSILISKKSKLIFESYFNGFNIKTKHDLRSATKSITSLLAGIAIDQKKISSMNDPIFNYLSELPNDSNKNKIKIVDLLKMASGLDSDDWKKNSKGHERFMYRSDDWRKFMLEVPVIEDPGKYFRYSTGGVFLLGQVIEEAVKEPIPSFAGRYLFAPLEIKDVEWEFTKKGQPDTGGHLKMKPRDMLKIGLLVLNKGQWNKKGVVSSEWINNSTKKWVSVEDVYSYGHLWWLRDFKFKDQIYKAIFAWGNGGQFIFIVPKLDAVVIFTGSNYNSDKTKQPFEIIEKIIVPLLAETEI
jgi:CubicO group peptidase (beta-lactamase class C family)